MFINSFIKASLPGLIALFLLFNMEAIAINCACDCEDKSCTANSQIICCSLPETLENNIKEAIENIYGCDQVPVIYPKVLEIIKKARENRPLKLYMDDLSRPSDWYKDEIIYMFYVDQFGTKDKYSKNTFKDLIGMLDYLEDLGVTTIFMLPYLDSPMGDAGFDVRDPKNVRDDLGGLKEFGEFITEAKSRGFKIKSDLVFNHLSDQHKWFQDYLNGDETKAEYFISRKEMPEYKKYVDEKLGVIVEYTEPTGEVSKRFLMFPDTCETNFRKVTVNGQDRYFYHTFYPFQLDVNWENPEVLYYMLDVIAYWANIGIDIFRMDAIPFYIKESGTSAESLPKTHEVIKLLSSFAQAISPRSVMLAEACHWPEDITPYFGKEKNTDTRLLCGQKKKITRTDEVQIAYHFPYMQAIWATLVTGDGSHFWEVYNKTPHIPPTTAWAVFLRVHDELTLGMIDVETKKLIYNSLINNGAEFRKGFGVSGRMANFLENDPERIESAFSILLSLPGIPIIYYGDEIGAQNNWEYAKASEKQREAMAEEKGEELNVISFFDSRDVNRGPITKEAFYNAQKNDDTFSGQIHEKIKNLIHVRKANKIMSRGEFEKVNAKQDNVFTYLRKLDDMQVLVVNNLSSNDFVAEVKLPNQTAKMIDSNSSLNDLISDEKIDLTKSLGKNVYKITLKPYQSVWIKLGE